MRKIFLKIFLFACGVTCAQNGIQYTKPAWNLTGNNIATGSPYIGTQNAVSLFMKSNTNTINGYLKLDSLDFLTWKIDNSSAATPNVFSLRKYPPLTTIPAVYFGSGSFTGTNYFLLTPDTNQIIINARTNLLFNTGHRRFMSTQSTYTTGGTIVTFDAITNTLSVTNQNMRHVAVSGLVTNYANGGTTSLNQQFLISADTHSTLSGETANITNDVCLEVNAPTAAGGLTQTNAPFAIYCKGQMNVTTNVSIGGSLTVPLARLHLLGGSATQAVLHIASQTLLTTTVTGMVERNSGDLYWTNSVGRMKVGLVLTGSATLNFASTAAGASTDLTITVTNALDGDPVSVGVPNASTLANGVFTAWVSAANTVTVRFTNTNLVTALDPASGTFKVSVSKN